MRSKACMLVFFVSMDFENLPFKDMWKEPWISSSWFNRLWGRGKSRFLIAFTTHQESPSKFL
ncbi:hypothetical protein CJ030_MR5G003607 [Morella rubra]|uniref:Uncharacterized protein n=1 Tax=Morella rubra TaxID=262757 RepID=A0A6A1VKS3_9ROSI|nr:hypothetical protein CJ030_MR5G003607 [Morella rubra]